MTLLLYIHTVNKKNYFNYKIDIITNKMLICNISNNFNIVLSVLTNKRCIIKYIIFLKTHNTIYWNVAHSLKWLHHRWSVQKQVGEETGFNYFLETGNVKIRQSVQITYIYDVKMNKIHKITIIYYNYRPPQPGAQSQLSTPGCRESITALLHSRLLGAYNLQINLYDVKINKIYKLTIVCYQRSSMMPAYRRRLLTEPSWQP